jgi:tetratricopeptide (TPR) repeat protein
MARKLTFRQLVVLILALWNDLSQKEIAGRVRMTPKRLSALLTRERKKEIDDDVYELLLSVVARRRAGVSLVRACLDALDALDRESGLAEDEQVAIEEEVLEGSRLMRRYLTSAALRSRTPRPADGYPHAIDLPVCRHWAEEQLAKLKKVPRRSRLAVVRLGREYQHWSLVERCCEESVREASRSLKSAASWARLALAISRLITGPEDWRRRVQGYALAHWGNLLRVRGALKAADACLEEAKQLWESGSDPIEVLDPGRLLDLEGALRRAQRRFDEALDCFDRAIPVSRFPERALLNKGFTYEVMGDYESAIRTFREAEPYVERRGDSRLRNILRLNLASALVHASHYGEAAELVEEVRRCPAGLGKIDLARIPWLEGRLQVGLGHTQEARRLLVQARQRFEAERMHYDVALALLEEAGLLLTDGRTAEVKALAPALAKLFESKGVHREALAALQTFQEAVEQEAATAELARRILQFLFRARHDQGLRFTS